MQRQAALRIPPPAEAATIRRLERINEEFESAVTAGDFQRMHESNDRFHAELFRLCNNDLLVSLIKTYMDLTYAVRGGLRQSQESGKIPNPAPDQLLSGTDSWALAQICVDHIQITKDQYLAAIRGPESSLTRIGVG